MLTPTLRPIPTFDGYFISRRGDVYKLVNAGVGLATLPISVSTHRGQRRVSLTVPRSRAASGRTSRTIERLLRETWGR